MLRILTEKLKMFSGILKRTDETTQLYLGVCKTVQRLPPFINAITTIVNCHFVRGKLDPETHFARVKKQNVLQNVTVPSTWGRSSSWRRPPSW